MSQNETKIDGLTIILEDNEIEFEKQSAIKLYAKKSVLVAPYCDLVFLSFRHGVKVDGIITKTQSSHFPLMIWNQITSDLGPTMIGSLCQETTYSFIFGRLGIRNLRIFAFLHTAPKCDQ